MNMVGCLKSAPFHHDPKNMVGDSGCYDDQGDDDQRGAMRPARKIMPLQPKTENWLDQLLERKLGRQSAENAQSGDDDHRQQEAPVGFLHLFIGGIDLAKEGRVSQLQERGCGEERSQYRQQIEKDTALQ